MTAKPILLTVGGAGVLGGTIAPICYFATSGPRNIKELLIKEKQKPLNTANHDDDAIWKRLIQKLKKKCDDLFNSPITKDDKFKTNKDHAIAWCTKNSNFARG